MGDRSNIYFRNGESGIGVYAHWCGRDIAAAAINVINNRSFKERIGDASYATRIGVQEVLGFINVTAREQTGSGLWTHATGPDDQDYKTIIIDVISGNVYVSNNWSSPSPCELVKDPTAPILYGLM